MELTSQSIEQIENDYWPNLEDYPTNLIANCHAFRKIAVNELQIHQIIELLIQDIGTTILMPMALERMQKNILEEDSFDGSCFINSIGFFPRNSWHEHPEWHEALITLYISKKEELEAVWGWKAYERLLYKIKHF